MFEVLEPIERRRVAFVMNMGANGLGTARSLGRCGIPVIGMDFVRNAPGFASKYVDPLPCPDPVTQPDDLLGLLAERGAELGEKGVLFPCSDASINFVSKNRTEISKWFELTIPSNEVIEGLIDKRIQYGWAIRLGIPVPNTLFFSDLREVREMRGQIEFPCFVKPLISHLWNRKFGNKGFIVRDQQELETRFAQVEETGLEAMVQKVLMPPGENIRGFAAYFGRNGYVSPIFTWEKTRQDPPNFGVGSCVRSRWFPDIAELGRRFAQGIGFIGIGSMGFKLDPDDGIWKLIEMNSRLWMQNYHAASSGLNLALLQYLDSQGITLPSLNRFDEGIVWWDSLSDFQTYVRLRRRHRIGFREWIDTWFLPDVHAYYEKGDAKPALVRSRYGLEWIKSVATLIKMREDQDAIWDDLGNRT